MVKKTSGITDSPVPDIPQELLDSLDASNCVLFAGSGLSASAGVLSWTEILPRLVDLGLEHALIDRAVAESYHAALREGEMSSVADGIVYAFDAERGRLQDFLRKTFEGSGKLSPSHQALQKVPFSSVLTGNLDSLLESALPRYCDNGLFTPADIEPLMDAFAKRRPFLLKLYGVIDKPETLTIAPMEYRELVASNVSFLKFLEGMLVSQTLFFVGLSLDGILEFLSATPFRGGSQPRRHFALVAVRGAAWKSKADLLERRFNVKVIPYKESAGHLTFVTFLTELGSRFDDIVIRAAAAPQTEPTFVPGIRKLLLENIGSFEKLEIDFSVKHPWKVLLGDNGVGKSTVLKAIAVAVIGDDARTYAGRLVRAGQTRGRITVSTERNSTGYITEILTKDIYSDASVISRPSRCMEAEGWLAVGFSPLRTVSWKQSTGPQRTLTKGRPTADDLIPLLSGEVDKRMDRLKQWLVNLYATDVPAQADLRGHQDRVTSLAFTSDGLTLFSGSTDQTVMSWSVATGLCQEILAGHKGGINAITLSADDRTLASASFDRSVHVWDALTGKLRYKKSPNNSQVLSVGLSKGRPTLAWGTEGGTLRWDSLDIPKGRANRGELKKGAIWSLAVSSNGERIFVGCERGCSIVSVNFAHEEKHHVFHLLDTATWGVALSFDQRTLLVGTSLGALHVYDCPAGGATELRYTVKAFDVGALCVSISANGKVFAAGSENGEAGVWDINTGQIIISSQVGTRGVWSVALSPDGQTLAAGSDDGMIRLIPVPLSVAPTQQKEVIERLFQVIAMLTDRTDIQFRRVTDLNRVIVATAEAPTGIPLEMLSQGLTSLLGWVGYLCQRMKETYTDNAVEALPLNGYALVLLDEIDAHMHPRWQQVLVSRLKKLFPRVQFIVSTHSPLIAAGLEAEEVLRFERGEGGMVEVTSPDYSLKGIGAAGLLTSDMFGLSSQLDEETAQALNEKRQLIGRMMREVLTEEEQSVIAARMVILNDIVQSVDASMSHRDPLYATFVQLMAQAGEADLSLTPLTAEQRDKKAQTAERIAASLRFHDEAELERA